MQSKARTFSPGDRVVIEISFACEGSGEIESVEAVFAREGSGEQILLLGDSKKRSTGEGERAAYTARLEAKIDPDVTPGKYSYARLSARDRFDDDWDFTDATGLNLVICVERASHRLEVTTSDFL